MSWRAEILESLIELMNDRGWSNTDLAAALGVSSSVLSMWKARTEISTEGVEPALRLLGMLPKPGAKKSAEVIPFARDGVVVESWELDDGVRSIPQLAVAASMGSGAIVQEHIDVVRRIAVSVPELRKQASFTSPQNLSFITGKGDSMMPTYSDGDVLLVDEGVREHNLDAVYVFTYQGELYIKTLQRIPGNGIRAISHNRAVYDPFMIEPGLPFQIHGRVVMAWNAKRL